jgi:membrane protein DedA with SNARE-associated domain
MLVETFNQLADWYMAHMNYGTIVLLMALESTFVPLPSEIVIPPAAWKAADPSSGLNLGLVILFATIGCVLGALFNYFLAYFLGRKIVYSLADSKYARLFLVKRDSVEKAEAYFIKHGRSSTFIGRLVPGIRHLISIPAGLAKMNLKDFILFTFIGSAIWNTCLAFLGYFFYSQKELLDRYFKELSWIVLGLGLIFVVYLIVRARKKAVNKK